MQSYILEYMLKNVASRDKAMCSSKIAEQLSLREVSVARTLRKIRADSELPYSVFKVLLQCLAAAAVPTAHRRCDYSTRATDSCLTHLSTAPPPPCRSNGQYASAVWRPSGGSAIALL